METKSQYPSFACTSCYIKENLQQITSFFNFQKLQFSETGFKPSTNSVKHGIIINHIKIIKNHLKS